VNKLILRLKAVRRVAKDLLALLMGAGLYAFRRTTPDSAHQAMIRLFCWSGGRSNDLITMFIRISNRKAALPRPSGELGLSTGADAERIANHIRCDGYYVFDQRLSADICDRLLDFALHTPAKIRPAKGDPMPADAERLKTVYDRRNPLAVRYDFDTGDVLNCADVQSIMVNPGVLSVAQSYLNSTPIADVVSMWWHTAFSDQPDEEAAQFFHFDMDRIKWLKFFIYLTDVGPDNGPHCFVRGSHLTKGIPAALLSKGYARLSNEEVSRHYRQDQIVQFVAPRGTVLAEDTRGLHKGLEVRGGDRLMLQIQFSNSLFGGIYPRYSFRSMIPRLGYMTHAYPQVYQNYLGNGRF
jgi:ectoine hydroxylase-related dioxygenase (phytanoyl-CoA dioxygenase family)